MSYRIQIVCVWLGLVGVTLLFIGQWPLMGYLPPLDPAMSAEGVADYFRTNQNGILAGAIFLQFGAAFFFPFFAVLIRQVGQIEGASRVWAPLLTMGTVLAFVTIFIAYAIWTAAAYRPDRPDEMIRMLNDLACFPYIGVVTQAPLMYLPVGIPVAMSKAERPLFPRWFGFFTIWVALLSETSVVIGLFYSGPFAWNGWIGFWIPAVIFGVWMTIAPFYMHAAVKRELQEADSAT